MTILLVQRVQRTVLEEDADSLANRLSEQLSTLEGGAHTEPARVTTVGAAHARRRSGA